jgi:hypothetical protein
LCELVGYVRDADPRTLETRSLEWKRTWNLAKPEIQFQIARQILGFGNRLPVDAARAFGGYAYLLIGVHPGEVQGIDIPDPAQLTNALRRFVAASQPSWEATFVRVDDADVLVVEVAPPRDGDRICCLARGYGDVQAGRVFVRRVGQTAEADPTEVRALEDRLLAAITADARHATQAQKDLADVTREQLAHLSTRTRRDQEARARQRAPTFVKSKSQPAFVFIEPNRMEGRLRNMGESDATVTLARLHRDGPGAAPGSMRAIYPSRQSEPTVPVLIPHGIDLGLVFDNAVLRGVASESLTLVLQYDDDGGFTWSAEISLRRKGKDAQDRQVWVLSEVSSRML